MNRLEGPPGESGTHTVTTRLMLVDADLALPPILDHPLLDAMQAERTLSFHLTGSRFAGTARPDSDWDFLVADTGAARAWLAQHEFRPMLEAEYDNVEGISVWPGVKVGDIGHGPHPYTTGVWGVEHPAGAVQVKLTRSVEGSAAVRDLVVGNPLLCQYDRALHGAGDREGRARLWMGAARLIALAIPAPAPAVDPEPDYNFTGAFGDDFPF